jgi:hypothetical protein
MWSGGFIVTLKLIDTRPSNDIEVIIATGLEVCLSTFFISFSIVELYYKLKDLLELQENYTIIL